MTCAGKNLVHALTRDAERTGELRLIGARLVRSQQGAAEVAGGAVLALSAAYIAFNEGLANWQSLWLCAALVALAVNLVQVRDAPG